MSCTTNRELQKMQQVGYRLVELVHILRLFHITTESYQAVLAVYVHVTSSLHAGIYILFFGEKQSEKSPLKLKHPKPPLLQCKSYQCSSSPFRCQESLASCCCLVRRFGTECHRTKSKLGLNGLWTHSHMTIRGALISFCFFSTCPIIFSMESVGGRPSLGQERKWKRVTSWTNVGLWREKLAILSASIVSGN